MRRILCIAAAVLLALGVAQTNAANNIPGVDGAPRMAAVAEETASEVEVALSDPAGIDENASAALAITAESFPDNQFRRYVSADLDLNGDGALSKREREAVTLIDVSGKRVASLAGIGGFPKLESLYCADNKIATLDLSGNPALVELDGASNQLTRIKLNANVLLERVNLRNNKIERIEADKCTRLTELDLAGNALGAISLQSFARLKKLDVSDNALKRLDLSNNGALEELDCGGNRLTALDLSGNARLKTLVAKNNALKSLDIARCARLARLDVRCNALTALKVARRSKLVSLRCDDNKLEELDASGCPALEKLTCKHNQIHRLRVDRDASLKTLSFRDNSVKRVDVSQCDALRAFDGRDNIIGLFDISKLPAGMYGMVSGAAPRVANRRELRWSDKSRKLYLPPTATVVDGPTCLYGMENIFSNFPYIRMNDPKYYPHLTSAEYANFRCVSTTGMGRHTLYRSSTPIREDMNRNAQAAAAMEAAGVRTILNLSDNMSDLRALRLYRGSYYSRQNVIARNLPSSKATETNMQNYLPFFRYIIDHEGPYLVHCFHGRDRTGTVCAILECLMGATADEVIDDFMKTYYCLYGIQEGDDLYDYIRDKKIVYRLTTGFGIDSLYDEDVDLAACAESLLLRSGLTAGEIEALKARMATDH